MGVDIAITDALVLTVDKHNRIYERGTVLIEDGRITVVQPTSTRQTVQRRTLLVQTTPPAC